MDWPEIRNWQTDIPDSGKFAFLNMNSSIKTSPVLKLINTQTPYDAGYIAL